MSKHLLAVLAVLFSASVALALPARAADDAKDAASTVRVFILAGQSNMEGKAKNELLDHQAAAEETKELFAHLREGDKWKVRDDVFIKFFERHGGLTIGYGSPGRTGSELEFGTVVGDHFSEPVLLIKTAWGGRSLVKDFRPPSVGLPSDEDLQAELDRAQQNVRQNNEKNQRSDPLPTMDDITSGYGKTYREMMEEVRKTLDEAGTLFPELKGKRLALTGFVWFQGWNDQYGGQDDYESNLAHFIRDIRKDLAAPELPVVIAVMGQNGSKPAEGAMKTIQQAQLAMQKLPDFAGNVKAVRTDVLIDKAAEKLFPQWRERTEEWERTGSDFPYHYLGSAIWFNRIGHALGEAMVELVKGG